MGLKRIPLDKIIRNENQPREEFDETKLNELASSIRQNGLLQPITVRSMGDGRFQIVAGERRYRAHKILAKRGHIDDGCILANVRSMDVETMGIEAIIENLQRVDLKPIEEARGFQRMLDQGWTVEKLAKRLGLTQPWRITYRTRLLSLADEIKPLVDSGQITLNAAESISKLGHSDQLRVVRLLNTGRIKTDAQVHAAVEAVEQNLSQEQLFGDAPAASAEQVAAVNRMEQRISQVELMVASGWKNGECTVALKVSPDRVKLMADKIGAIRKALAIMEAELRRAQSQAELVLAGRVEQKEAA